MEQENPLNALKDIYIPKPSNGDLFIYKEKTMAQQTAVDWLFDRFLFAGYSLPAEWREQAKAMEKEQIIKFAKDYAYDCVYCSDCSGEFAIEKNSEQYYNETYNK